MQLIRFPTENLLLFSNKLCKKKIPAKPRENQAEAPEILIVAQHLSGHGDLVMKQQVEYFVEHPLQFQNL